MPDGYPATDIPGGPHPFAGLRVASVGLVRDAVRALAHDDDAIAMLTLCAVHGFVVAASET